MAQQAPELIPRGYGGILDASLELYRQNFLLFVGIAGVAYIPLAVVQVLFAGAREASTAGVVATVVLTIVTVFLAIFVSGAMTKAISDVYLGVEASVFGSYRYVMRRWLPYIGTNLLCVLLVYAGIALCVIPGIIFAFWIAFASEVFVIEGPSGWEAIQRSRQLISGHWGRAFVLMFLVGVLGAILQMIPVSIITALLKESAAGQALSVAWQGIANTVVTPFSTAALILLYYDLRIRKEAFDLEVLAENMSRWGGAPTTGVVRQAEVAEASDPRGESLVETARCPACGGELPAGTAFCDHCGRDLRQSPG